MMNWQSGRPLPVADAIIVEKEMGVTPSEFRQMLVTSAGKQAVRQTEKGLQLNAPDGVVDIELSACPPRQIASLQIPVTQVKFIYPDWQTKHQARQQQWFDLHLRRGGG